MAQKAYFIGPYETGLETDKKPWLLPDNAFSYLRNAYVWRSRLKKRVGSRLFSLTGYTAGTQQLISRLRILINTTDGAGAATQAGGAIPGAIAGAACVGQMFSIGDEMFTVQAVGTPVTMLKTGATTTATYNTTTRAYTFVGAAINTDIYWYPALPVMGLPTYESDSINNEKVIAFDTRFSYKRSGDGWGRAGNLVWSGSDSQFFWGTNYRGATADSYTLFVVNNNRADGICYWNDAAFVRTTFSTKKNNQGAMLAANFVLQSARLIVSFKDCLIALNTIESVDDGAGNPVNRVFTNRARWCYKVSPFDAEAWQDDVGGGKLQTAGTKEAIISAQVLDDRLIVYFERSTWELVYTNNAAIPFLWQVIDASNGAESTFSSVLMDDAVLGIGQSGIYSCNGLDVERIDEKIPDEVFKIHNGNSGVERVAGIRDYYPELVYWTFPNSQYNTVYPDRVLVYNYRNKTWSFFDDSITAFGYYQNTHDMTWGEDTETWAEDASLWSSSSGQSLHRNVLAGNQQGWTFIMDRDIKRNSPALQVSNIDITGWPEVILTVKNHNIFANDPWIDAIIIENVQGITPDINEKVYIVVENTDTTVTALALGTPATPTGTYTGGGTIARASIIDIKTKDFNFYTNAMRVAISRIEIDVEKTVHGILFSQFYPSTSSDGIGHYDSMDDVFTIEMYPYDIYPFETEQKRLVRRIYPQAEGDSLKLGFFTNYLLSANGGTAFNEAISNFTLNSMTIYASPTATR